MVMTFYKFHCSALITAFEKSKKKYQGKMKRMEAQLQAMMERYETQVLPFFGKQESRRAYDTAVLVEVIPFIEIPLYHDPSSIFLGGRGYIIQ